MAQGDTAARAELGAGDIILRASARLEPLRQGELGELSGLYAAIDALRLLLAEHQSLDAAACADLYAEGIGFIDEAGWFPAAAISGVPRKLWRRLVRHLAKVAGQQMGVKIRVTRPFRRWPVSPEELLAAIAAAIQRNQPVLAPFAAQRRRYGVVCGISSGRQTSFFRDGQPITIKQAANGAAEAGEVDDLRLKVGSLLVLELR